MKKAIVAVVMTALLTIGFISHGGEISTMWQMPTERTDNTPLSLDEIAYTKVYFHDINKDHWTESKILVGETSLVINKPNGTYEIFATVTDKGNLESEGSNKITKIVKDEIPIVIITAPNPPYFILIE